MARTRSETPPAGMDPWWRFGGRAENELIYLYLSYFGYKAALRTMQGYWDKVRDYGKEPNPFMGVFAQFFGVANSEKEAWDMYREPAEYFFNRCLHVYAGFADPPGYKTVNTVRAGVEGMVKRAAREATARAEAAQAARTLGPAGLATGSSGLSFEEMVDKGYVIIGDPDQVAERMVEVATTLKVGHIMTLCQFGNMSKGVTLHNTELMATKVLPPGASPASTDPFFKDDPSSSPAQLIEDGIARYEARTAAIGLLWPIPELV